MEMKLIITDENPSSESMRHFFETCYFSEKIGFCDNHFNEVKKEFVSEMNLESSSCANDVHRYAKDLLDLYNSGEDMYIIYNKCLFVDGYEDTSFLFDLYRKDLDKHMEDIKENDNLIVEQMFRLERISFEVNDVPKSVVRSFVKWYTESMSVEDVEKIVSYYVVSASDFPDEY